MAGEKKSLEDRIKEEMTVNYHDALEKNFELAKELIAITPEGKVSLRKSAGLGGEDRILLYLVGKVYSKKAGFAEDEKVANEELMNELGVKEGSLFAWLKFLRDKNLIKNVMRGNLVYHYITPNHIERVLNEISKKVKKGE